jgi:hypothetical protein
MVNFQRLHHPIKCLCLLRLRLRPPVKGEPLPTMAASNLNTFVVAETEHLHLFDPIP